MFLFFVVKFVCFFICDIQPLNTHAQKRTLTQIFTSVSWYIHIDAKQTYNHKRSCTHKHMPALKVHIKLRRTPLASINYLFYIVTHYWSLLILFLYLHFAGAQSLKRTYHLLHFMSKIFDWFHYVVSWHLRIAPLALSQSLKVFRVGNRSVFNFLTKPAVLQ